jgi:hypothetical protein
LIATTTPERATGHIVCGTIPGRNSTAS